MWSSLIRIQKIIQKLRPLRVVYENDECGFTENPMAKNQFKMRLIDRNLGLIVIASIFGLKQVLTKNPPSKSTEQLQTLSSEDIRIQTQKMVMGTVLFILYLSIFLTLLVGNWSFKNQANSAVFMMNQARGLFLDREKNHGKIPGGPTKRESALFGALIYNLLICCFFGISAITVFPITSNNNPAHVIFTWILPAKLIEDRPFLIKTLASVYIGISGYFGIIPVIQAFAYIAGFLYELKYILRRSYKEKQDRAIFYGSKVPQATFIRHWLIYAQNILFVKEINQFGIALYPGIILVAFCINVVATTVCMKFHQELPGLMFLLFLVFDAVVAVATVVVHTFAVVAKEESEKFLLHWKPHLFSKSARTRLRACRPSAIYIGMFFMLKRSTLLNTVCEVVNMVVTLLLADQ